MTYTYYYVVACISVSVDMLSSQRVTTTDSVEMYDEQYIYNL